VDAGVAWAVTPNEHAQRRAPRMGRGLREPECSLTIEFTAPVASATVVQGGTGYTRTPWRDPHLVTKHEFFRVLERATGRRAR